MKRQVAPPSLETAGRSEAAAFAKVISRALEKLVTGVLLRIVCAVTSTGSAPDDQTVPAGPDMLALCGVIWMIRPSPGVVGTTDDGQVTAALWSELWSVPPSPGSAVFAVALGTPVDVITQTEKCVMNCDEVTPSLIVPVRV